MAKLWQKDYELDKLVEKFTVGEDYILDQNLVVADCVASLAHAVMLESIKILNKQELGDLRKGLIDIIKLHEQGKFIIKLSDEDVHTAIENYLVKKIGLVGKKIHTARSRNDQVIAAIRLYTRDFLIKFQQACLDLIQRLVDFAQSNKHVPMPGRTHMQIAMPSSVGLWAAAYAEELLDDYTLLETAYKINDMCPLGSAASYGVPLPIDREFVAELLGFSRLQNNVLYVNNSRGKVESIVLGAVEQVILSLSKLAQDLIIFSMPEFQYFSLPDELCSGSSIMPQKKNPCALELLRAKSSSITMYTTQIKSIIKALPSGYNRDFQETKSPFMKGINTGLNCVRVMDLTINKIRVNEQNLARGFIPEIFATDAALELVKKGVPFRDAYKQVGRNLDRLQKYDPKKAINAKKHIGATGNLGLEKAIKQKETYLKNVEQKKQKIKKIWQSLIGFKVNLFFEF